MKRHTFTDHTAAAMFARDQERAGRLVALTHNSMTGQFLVTVYGSWKVVA